jgi:hypothetical protein
MNKLRFLWAICTCFVVNVGQAATIYSQYLDGLTGIYTPDTTPEQIESFDFGVVAGAPIISLRYEFQGTVVFPTYKDTTNNNIYEAEINHQGGLDNWIGWGASLKTSSWGHLSNNLDIDYVLNTDNSFYFSHIYNNGTSSQYDRSFPSGNAEMAFYTYTPFDLSGQPGFENIWQDLVLVSPGMIIVESMRISFSTDYLLADPFNLETRFSAVPLPPALWLFGSGLLGLIGLATRKKVTYKDK